MPRNVAFVLASALFIFASDKWTQAQSPATEKNTLSQYRRDLFASAFTKSINSKGRADLLLLYGGALATPVTGEPIQLKDLQVVSSLIKDKPQGFWLNLPIEHRLRLADSNSKLFRIDGLELDGVSRRLEDIKNTIDVTSNVTELLGQPGLLGPLGQGKAWISLLTMGNKIVEAKTEEDIQSFVSACNSTLRPHANEVGLAIYDWYQQNAGQNPVRKEFLDKLNNLLSLSINDSTDELINKSEVSDVVKSLLHQVQSKIEVGDNTLSEALQREFGDLNQADHAIAHSIGELLSAYKKEDHNTSEEVVTPPKNRIEYRNEIESGVNILCTLLKESNPTLAARLTSISRATFIVYDAGISANAGLVGSLFVANQYMLAICLIQAAFDEPEKDPDQLRFEAVIDNLRYISDSITEFRRETSVWFKEIDEKLLNISTTLRELELSIAESRRETREHISNLRRITQSLGKDLSHEMSVLRDANSALIVQSLHEKRNHVISLVRNNSAPLPSALGFEQYLSYCSVASAFGTDGLSGTTRSGAFAASLSGSSDMDNPAMWANIGSRPVYTLFGGLHHALRAANINTDRIEHIPNPVEWHYAADLLVRLLKEKTPKVSPQFAEQSLRDMLTVGMNLLECVTVCADSNTIRSFNNNVTAPLCESVRKSVARLNTQAQDEVLARYGLKVDTEAESPMDENTLASFHKRLTNDLSKYDYFTQNVVPVSVKIEKGDQKRQMFLEWDHFITVTKGPDKGRTFHIGRFNTNWAREGSMGSLDDSLWGLKTYGGFDAIFETAASKSPEQQCDPNTPWWEAVKTVGIATRSTFAIPGRGYLFPENTVFRTLPAESGSIDYIFLPVGDPLVTLPVRFATAICDEIDVRTKELIENQLNDEVIHLTGCLKITRLIVDNFCLLPPDLQVKHQLTLANIPFPDTTAALEKFGLDFMSNRQIDNSSDDALIDALESNIVCVFGERTFPIGRLLVNSSMQMVKDRHIMVNATFYTGETAYSKVLIESLLYGTPPPKLQLLEYDLEPDVEAVTSRIPNDALSNLHEVICRVLTNRHEALQSHSPNDDAMGQYSVSKMPSDDDVRERLRASIRWVFASGLIALGYPEKGGESELNERSGQIRQKLQGSSSHLFLSEHTLTIGRPRSSAIGMQDALEDLKKRIQDALVFAVDVTPMEMREASSISGLLTAGQLMQWLVQKNAMTESSSAVFSNAMDFLAPPSDESVTAARMHIADLQNVLGDKYTTQNANAAFVASCILANAIGRLCDEDPRPNTAAFDELEGIVWLKSTVSQDPSSLRIGAGVPGGEFMLWISLMYMQQERLAEFAAILKNDKQSRNSFATFSNEFYMLTGVDVNNISLVLSLNRGRLPSQFSYLQNDCDALDVMLQKTRHEKGRP